jgi:DNA mismatch endonuclease, patch repair protein
VDYWTPKIVANRARDARKHRALWDLGWRAFTVWECELKAASLSVSVERLAAALNEVSKQGA